MFFIPLHLAAIALFMYLYARHEADITPIKLAAVFTLPLWFVHVLHKLSDPSLTTVAVLGLGCFVILFLALKLWFYVNWGQAAMIGASFGIYIAGFYLLYEKVKEVPEIEAPDRLFITTSDEHRPYKGVKILTSNQSDTLICQITVKRDMVLDKEFKSAPGWFVYCESEGSYWVYSGGVELVHLRISEDQTEVRDTTSDPNIVRSAPSEARKRMSAEATKGISQGQSRLGRKKPKPKRKPYQTDPTRQKRKSEAAAPSAP